MSKKRMLESYTHRYEHFPAWLTILIACVMVVLFFFNWVCLFLWR